jgi:uncharacterized lipoprotein
VTRLALMASLATLLAGCFGSRNVDDRCDEVSEYQASRSVPGLQTPEGLVAPNRASGYAVPPASGAELRGAACLARPPPYFRPDPSAAPPVQPGPGEAPRAN